MQIIATYIQFTCATVAMSRHVYKSWKKLYPQYGMLSAIQGRVFLFDHTISPLLIESMYLYSSLKRCYRAKGRKGRTGRIQNCWESWRPGRWKWCFNCKKGRLPSYTCLQIIQSNIEIIPKYQASRCRCVWSLCNKGCTRVWNLSILTKDSYRLISIWSS